MFDENANTFALFAQSALAAKRDLTSIFYKSSASPRPSSLRILTLLTSGRSRMVRIDDTRPPLHIGASRIVEYPSGSSSAEFLIAFPLGSLFIEILTSCQALKKSGRTASLHASRTTNVHGTSPSLHPVAFLAFPKATSSLLAAHPTPPNPLELQASRGVGIFPIFYDHLNLDSGRG
jgi:hypothetical protein